MRAWIASLGALHRQPADPEFFAGFDVAQIEGLALVGKPAVLQLAMQVLADDDQLAAAKANEKVDFVAFYKGGAPGYELHRAVRMPRRAIEPNERVVVFGGGAKGEHGVGPQPHVEAMLTDAVGVQPELGGEVCKFI